MTAGEASHGDPRHGRPWRAALALIVCLLVVAAVSWAKADLGQHRVVTDTAALGQQFQMRAMKVKVTDVTVASALTESDERHLAHGVFVVVAWTMEAVHGPTGVASQNLELRTADGHVYLPTGSSMVNRGNPGFVLSQTAVFDVPPDRVAGAVMVIPPPGSTITGGYDRELAVPLRITATSRPAAAVPKPTSTSAAVTR